MNYLPTTTFSDYCSATVTILRLWSKTLETIILDLDAAETPIPGRNGRLFGYRAIQDHGRAIPTLPGIVSGFCETTSLGESKTSTSVNEIPVKQVRPSARE